MCAHVHFFVVVVFKKTKTKKKRVTHEPFWHFLDLALTDRVIFMPYRCIMLSEASFKTPAVLLIVVLLSPIQTTAINSSLHNRCVFFQKHNIAIICQLIPAWTQCIVNPLWHTHAQPFFLFERHTNAVQNKPAHRWSCYRCCVSQITTI